MTPSIVVEARKPGFPSHKDQALASILLYYRIGSIRRSARAVRRKALMYCRCALGRDLASAKLAARRRNPMDVRGDSSVARSQCLEIYTIVVRNCLG